MGVLLNYILKPLSLIGALNWGLVGIFRFDLVAWIFGPMTMLTRFVYAIIGIAAFFWLLIWIFGENADESEHNRRR